MKVFSFEEALYQIKLGSRVARSGWNGKGMYLFMTDEGSVQVSQKAGGGFHVPKLVWIKTTDSCIVPWLCSQADLMAEDWTLVATLLTETGA